MTVSMITFGHDSDIEFKLTQVREKARCALKKFVFRDNSRLLFMRFCADYPLAWHKYRQLCDFLVEIVVAKGHPSESDLLVMLREYGIPLKDTVTCFKIFKQSQNLHNRDSAAELNSARVQEINTADDMLSAYELEFADLRECVHAIIQAAEYQKNPRLPFRQFCVKRLIGGIEYVQLTHYIDEIFNNPSDTDLATLTREYGIEKQDISECLDAFERQYRKGSKETFQDKKREWLKILAQPEGEVKSID